MNGNLSIFATMLKSFFRRHPLILILMLIMNQCQEGPELIHFDIQGHRGARALYPENSLPGFAFAASIPIQTLEMDLICTAAGEVLVSHEPWLNPEICLGPHGDTLKAPLNLFNWDLETIQSCDCGQLPHPRFSNQRKMSTFKPTLAQVVEKVARVPRPEGMPPVRFNAEIKHKANQVGTHHLTAAEAAQRVLSEIDRLQMTERITIQSFSANVLEAVHEQAPEISTAWLMEDSLTVVEALNLLSFLPNIYSPNHMLLSREEIAQAHAMGVAVIPWTVNDAHRMVELINWGVDGLITDDPVAALQVVQQFQHPAQF